MSEGPATRPTVRLLPRHHRRARAGHPWVFSNEIDMDAAAKSLEPGVLVTLAPHVGEPLGVATFNPKPLISARLLSRDPGTPIDSDFIAARLRAALDLRRCFYPEPFYRLVHAEADALPGLVVDRYGDVVVCQMNCAGMERLTDHILAALDEVLAPETVVLRNDSAARGLEGCELGVRVAKGRLSGPVELVENGVRLFADPLAGQKTGWFFDQRRNRAFIAGLAEGRRLLDLYAYAGGFAVEALVAGAREAVAVDRSEAALDLAAQAARANGVSGRCRFEKADAFGLMARLAEAGERFEIVVADPPAFVKTKKDLAAGAKGYRKMTRRAAALVAPGGLLFVASCSYNVDAALFGEQVRRGLVDARRTGRILREAGAGPDHPVHPHLPETAYLKTMTLQLD